VGKIEFEDLGMIDYESALAVQTEHFENNILKKTNGFRTVNKMLFCEHPHVYTLGKHGQKSNLLVDENFLKSIGATFFLTDRGGDITYHGPGQFVGYPILDLDTFQIGTKEYVMRIELKIVKILADYGISGEHSENAAGVWLDIGKGNERKICAVGVKVSHGITMHGFALNVNTDLSYFKHINPCGFTEKTVTSIQKEIGNSVDFMRIKQKIKEEFLFF
jgi:lipoyl(octanoyl) transferase